MNNVEKLIFQVSTSQSIIVIEKNDKGVGGGRGDLPSPQPNNYIYYNNKLLKIDDIAYGFCPLNFNYASFYFYFSMA